MSLKNSENDKFILIDGNALVHRAYHAFPPTLTISKSGQQVNAVYGFSKLILDVFEKFKPKYAICAFDTKKPTIRHTQYVGYKATRKPMDSELAEQFPLVYEVVEAFNIPLYRIEGFEADDIIGTIAGMDLGDNIDKIIVSGDQDLLQLINQNTYAYLAGGSFKDSMLYDSHAVKNKFSFGPEYIVDYKSIKGDPSDNIPGVKGIGDKGAKDLINKFGHLEEIYTRIEEVDKKLQNKLIEFHEEAVMSKNLATIMTDVPLSFSLKDGLFKDFNKDKLTELFTQFEFRSLLTKIPKTQTEIDGGQASIFDTDNKVHNGNSKNKAITDQKEALVKLEKLSEAEEFAFYAVPDSEEHIDAKPIGMGFATENQEFFIAESILFESEVSSILKNLFSKTDKRKISYDIKLTLHMLKNIGITEVKAYEDVLLQSYLVAKGESRLEIKDLAFNLNGEVVLSWDELFDGKKSNQNPRMLAIERIVQFSISNAKAILKLNKKMISSIKESSKVEKLYYEIELKVARILFDMEQNGIKLNTKHLENFSGEMKADLSQLENEIYKFIGHEFNINSPKQLGDVLFGELGLPGGKKTKSGGFSTNERVLRDIMKSHPAVEKILEYRELNKLNSTYTFALIDKVNKKTNRIHANFNQAVTSTGRLSSNNPNLQNIPISSEKANKIRKAFEADEGNVLLGLDIAQQELRVVSVLSREEKLIQAFKNSQDIHALTASEVFGIPIESVDSEKRRVGKTLNFSLLYGISAFGLSDRLKMSREESQEMIDKFWQGYPNIKKYFDNLLLEAREKGYAETYFGRRRSAAGLSSKNFQIRSATEREIINFPIQGTSAELMKLAMIAVDEYIDENELELNPKIILQVHDELILEIKNISEKKTAELAGILKARMEGVIDFEVPLLVEPKTGHDWSNMKNINI